MRGANHSEMFPLRDCSFTAAERESTCAVLQSSEGCFELVAGRVAEATVDIPVNNVIDS
jgi:hypothetical protein